MPLPSPLTLRPKRRVATAAIAAGALLAATTPTVAAVFDLSWTGQFAGFTIDGVMAFDPGDVPADGIVRPGDFTDFDWSLFDADGDVIAAFEDDHLSPGFNANYDVSGGVLLQTGRWDEPDGLSIGAAFGEGLNIWSIGFPGMPPGDVFNPHIHVSDWQNEFPQYPFQFGNPDFVRHIDGAFFLRTASQITGDPAAGDDFGMPIAVTPVPLPAGAPLLAASLVVLGLARRRAPVDSRPR